MVEVDDMCVNLLSCCQLFESAGKASKVAGSPEACCCMAKPALTIAEETALSHATNGFI